MRRLSRGRSLIGSSPKASDIRDHSLSTWFIFLTLLTHVSKEARRPIHFFSHDVGGTIVKAVKSLIEWLERELQLIDVGAGDGF